MEKEQARRRGGLGLACGQRVLWELEDKVVQGLLLCLMGYSGMVFTIYMSSCCLAVMHQNTICICAYV